MGTWANIRELVACNSDNDSDSYSTVAPVLVILSNLRGDPRHDMEETDSGLVYERGRKAFGH